MSIKFADIQFQVPDLKEFKLSCDQWQKQIDGDDLDAILAVIGKWDVARREIKTWQAMTELRFHQDTRNAEFKAAQERCDELSPKITELDVAVKRQLVGHPLRQQLSNALGEHCFALWESDVQSYDPLIEKDVVAESALKTEYSELLASAKLQFLGETYNHEGIDKFKFDADGSARHDSMQAKWNWFTEHGPALDDMFDRMVRLRDGMAKKLGMKNYVELGYRCMSRVDYDQADVESYRTGIRKHVVPVCEQLCRQQAATLGIDKVMFWDEAVNRPQGNPVPRGDHDWMVAQAQTMFDNIGHGMGEFYRLMAEDGFLDLKNREGKAGGGFCTDFPSAGMPYVFANFNGTVDDVRVFTHEIGHAFQGYSSRDKQLTDYLWPTYDACEIHSMGLEFLTFPHMDLFFGEEANVFCEDHLVSSIMFLPYGVAVDHFQHLVYENPTATPAERHTMWQEMERTYLPFRDYGDLPYIRDGGRWQLQRHIYLDPFYYIDYTLALACALQFWSRSRKDMAGSMEDYVALCQRGGEAPFQTLAKSAGLTSPFHPDALESVMKEVKTELRIDS